MLQLAFVNFRPNSYVLVENTPSNGYFFIIQSGKVQCYNENPIPGVAAKTLGPGDFVGVVACMSGHSETETVRALTPVVAIMIKRNQYSELIMQNTPIAMKIVRSFARDMRIVNDQLTKLTVNKSNMDTPELIYEIADYYENSGYTDIACYGYYQYIKECPGGINIETAKKRYMGLKQKSRAVYFESTPEHIRTYPKDTMIFSECQHGSDMFIIQDGSVKIVKVVDSKEVVLAVLKKGDMFGEMALLENKPRSASIIAHENCKLMVVNRSNFDQMVATQAQMISKLTTMLADRMWAMYRQLSNTQIKDLREKLVDILSLQMEKSKAVYPKGTAVPTDISIQDLIGIASIPKEQWTEAERVILTDQHIKMTQGKIVIPDVADLIRQAAFYRKQSSKRAHE